MENIKIVVIGIGNCAHALIQGTNYCRNSTAEEVVGLVRWDIGGYKPSDIEVVVAFGIDRRKAGKPMAAMGVLRSRKLEMRSI